MKQKYLWLIGLFILTCSLSYAADKPGHFSYYVFNQSWLPEFCYMQSNACDNVEKSKLNRFGLHGLWPTQKNPKNHHFIMDCQKPLSLEAIKYRLTKRQWAELKKLYRINIDFIVRHEWNKHGTCSGLSVREYFLKVINIAKKMSRPGLTSLLDQDYTIDYKKLAASYGGGDKVILECYFENHKQYLTGLETFWNKDSKQIKNPSVSVPSQCDKRYPIIIRHN